MTFWPGGDRRAHVREVLERVRADKPAQLQGWGISIVALLHGLDESLADVLAGLMTRNDWPFWRIYWIDAGSATLAWTASDGAIW